MTIGTNSNPYTMLFFVLRWLLLAGVILLALALPGTLVENAPPFSDHVPLFAGIAAAGGLTGSFLLSFAEALAARGAAKRSADQERVLVAEAHRLRATRERTRAIYEMATALSGTLDHRRVMEATQNIGTLNLREDLGTDARLISAVLLFQGKENKLRVVTSRGLTPTDQNVSVSGQRGVLGLALKQAQPVFGGQAINDPELRYFAAFQDAKSVLAIPLGAGFDLYGVIVFGCDQPNAFSDEHVELMTAIGTQSTLSLQNAVLYQNLLGEKEKIVQVEENARKKLSRDLHDGPTQSVAAIAMRANYIRRLIERQPQQAIEELWKVEDLARRTTKEIRHMLFTMRPLVLENQGLIAALRQLAEKMKDTHNTDVVVQAQPEIESYMDLNAQGVLFYIIEEAVNNARKHAKSEQIWVRLLRQEHFIIVEVEDNGIGFDVEAVDANYDQRGSLGMINMRERADLIEGQLRVQSAKGKGTKISVLIPFDAASAAINKQQAVPPLQLQSQREARQASRPVSDEPLRPITPSRPITPAKRPITHIPGAGPLSDTGSTPSQIRPITGEPPRSRPRSTPSPQPKPNPPARSTPSKPPQSKPPARSPSPKPPQAEPPQPKPPERSSSSKPKRPPSKQPAQKPGSRPFRRVQPDKPTPSSQKNKKQGD